MKIAFIGGYGHLGSGLADLAERSGHEVMRLGREDSKSYLDVELVVLTTPPSKTIFCLEEELDMKDDVPLISFVAGISLEHYALHSPAGAVKAMTNIAACDGKGFTVWGKSEVLKDPIPLSRIYAFMDMLGESQEIKGSSVASLDAYLDTATALIGSGTAYIVQLLENFVEFGRKDNLPEEWAKLWVAQTVKGSLFLADQYDAVEVVQSIATVNGTTEAGLRILEDCDSESMIHHSLEVTAERCRELGENH